MACRYKRRVSLISDGDTDEMHKQPRYHGGLASPCLSYGIIFILVTVSRRTYTLSHAFHSLLGAETPTTNNGHTVGKPSRAA